MFTFNGIQSDFFNHKPNRGQHVKVCILCVSSIVFKTMWIICQGKIYIALKHSCLNNGDIS